MPQESKKSTLIVVVRHKKAIIEQDYFNGTVSLLRSSLLCVDKSSSKHNPETSRVATSKYSVLRRVWWNLRSTHHKTRCSPWCTTARAAI